MRSFIVISLLFLLLAYGCVLVPKYEEKLSEVASRVEPSSESQLVINLEREGKVLAFACKNKTAPRYPVIPSFIQYFLKVFDTSLLGGECGFFDLADEETRELLESSSYWQRPAGVGFGYNSYFSQLMARFCGGYMSYSAKVLPYVPGMGFLFSSLLPEEGACYLYRATIPIYIFSTNNGRLPSPDNSWRIVKKFEGVGPVMFVYLMGFNTSNEVQRKYLISNFKNMEKNCGNCLFGLFVYPWDDTLLKELEKDLSFNKSVDFIAIGVDNRIVKAKRGGELFANVSSFSAYVYERYGKPTLWTYVFLDGLPQHEQIRFYDLAFSQSRLLTTVGWMGFIAEPFLNTSEVGNCANCGFATYEKGNFVPFQPKLSRFSYFCEKYWDYAPYAVASNKNPFLAYIIAVSRGGSLPVYSQIQAIPKRDMSYLDQQPDLYECGSCFSTFGDVGEYLKSIGYKPKPLSVDCKDENNEFVQAIKIEASRSSIDPALLASLAEVESGFNRYAVSPIPQRLSSQCPAYIPPEDVTRLTDGEGRRVVNSWQFRDTGESGGFDPSAACSPSGSGEECGACAYGFLQVSVYPGSYAREKGIPLPDVVNGCGGENYDPFNPRDNACVASKMLLKKMAGIGSYVERNRYELGIGDNDTKLRAATLFGLAMSYHGDDPISFFTFVKEVNEISTDSDCEFATGFARAFCCSLEGSEGSDGEWYISNPACRKNLTPVEVAHMLQTSRVVEPYTTKTKYAYKVMEHYTYVSLECPFCSAKDVLRNICKQAEKFTGEDYPDC